MATRAGAPSGKTSQAAKVEQSKKRAYSFLTKAELDTLEKAARKNRWGKRDWLSIRMAYRHGLRASELVGLEWNDIDLDRGTVLIQRAKGGISSTHHLDGDVLRALRAIKRDQAPGVRHVFLSERGGPWASVSFSRMVERLGDEKLPDRGVHAHMLRHSCGHHLAAKGTDTRRIQDYLGHSSITSTRIYTQLQSIHLKNIWS